VLNALANVTFISGQARLVSPTDVEVNGERLSADKYLLVAMAFTRDISKLSCCV
jgi:pyruvate/2-oxoglutarate dehydrogenase complex dihydrolipoamide dehydrogenase (E3) component